MQDSSDRNSVLDSVRYAPLLSRSEFLCLLRLLESVVDLRKVVSRVLEPTQGWFRLFYDDFIARARLFLCFRVTFFAKQQTAEPDSRDTDLQMIGRQSLCITSKGFAKKRFRQSVLVAVHIHAG